MPDPDEDEGPGEHLTAAGLRVSAWAYLAIAMFFGLPGAAGLWAVDDGMFGYWLSIFVAVGSIVLIIASGFMTIVFAATLREAAEKRAEEEEIAQLEMRRQQEALRQEEEAWRIHADTNAARSAKQKKRNKH